MLEAVVSAYLAPVEVVVLQVLLVIGSGDIPLMLTETVGDFFYCDCFADCIEALWSFIKSVSRPSSDSVEPWSIEAKMYLGKKYSDIIPSKIPRDPPPSQKPQSNDRCRDRIESPVYAQYLRSVVWITLKNWCSHTS